MRIGEYEIIRLLGQGAMGIVYLARDRLRNRDVALKIPTVDLSDDSKQRQRFFREARLAATISHPNICPVYEVGREDGHVYIAMKYIDGRPLSDFVQPDSPLPIDQVAQIVGRLADAMQHAHRKGIVHRDLKPDNIFIDPDREPVVMDFGLAFDADVPTDVRLTQAGTIMGSPAYMSPEQVENDVEKIGPATDIYSLGVVLFELLTGRLPFTGSFASVLAQILSNEPPVPSKLRPEIHPALDSICLQMLAKQAPRRFESMGQVAAALKDFLERVNKESAAAGRSGRAEPTLSAFDRERAKRDARVERLEMHRRHVENLRKDGYYKTAIAMLERMAGLRDPRYADYATWARELIPVLREEPERIRKQRAEALAAAQLMIDRHEYLEAKELLQQIPPHLRTDAISAVLKDAVKQHAECELLIDQISQGFRTHETKNLLPKVERLLELRPGYKDAHLWYFRLTGKRLREDPRKRLVPPSYVWPLVVTMTATFAVVGWFVHRIWMSGIDTKDPVSAIDRFSQLDPAGAAKSAPDPVPKPGPEPKVAIRDKPALPQKIQPIAPATGNAPAGAITNSIGMKLVSIPSGEFQMGSAEGQENVNPNETPRHGVKITKAFYMGVYEVTQEEFQRVMGRNPSWFAASGPGNSRIAGADTKQFPVDSVSRADAAEFCRRLTALPGEQAAGRVYRLPTEAEWEYAARAGTDTRWFFGGDEAPLAEFAWYGGSNPRTQRIGTRKPNQFGLYDIYGNVWERCSDGYAAAYYRNSPAENPRGPGGRRTFDVKRGGGWGSNAAQCRSSYRGYYGMNLNQIGLRVVCTKR